jgi:hypothetical protein
MIQGMINEFGEEIKERDIKRIAEKIIRLSSEEIDILWFKCGWIDSAKGQNKALPISKIELMKKNKRTMVKALKNLFLETPRKEIEKRIKEIEQ